VSKVVLAKPSTAAPSRVGTETGARHGSGPAAGTGVHITRIGIHARITLRSVIS